MTTPANNPKSSTKSSLREYLILVLIICVGFPVAWYWGARDGRALAARAYGQTAPKAAAAASASDAGEKPSASTPEAVARGAALFQANCVACHGVNADGKGPAAVAFTPPPRNFTDPAAKWTQGREPAQIFATVTGGVPGTGMAGFGAALTDAQRWDLAHYIGSLPGAQAAAGKGAP